MPRTLLAAMMLIFVGDAALAAHPPVANSPSCPSPGRFFRRANSSGPAYDRPLPLGQVTDAFWETQQTGAEAADFIFYDHEFVGETTQLTPAGKKHLLQIALRLEHAPFPVVIEESEHAKSPALDIARRKAIVELFGRIGVLDAERRVVVAPSFVPGISASEAEAGYYNSRGAGGNYGGSSLPSGRWR